MSALMQSTRLRWPATILTIALLASFIAGRWYSASLAFGRTSIGISKGCSYFNQTKGVVDPNRRVFSVGLNGPPFDWAWWGAKTDDTRYRAASIPLWIPVVPAIIVTAGFWRPQVLSVHRRRAGRCHACGYDRRGLGAAACPECGTVPDVRQA